MGDPRDRQPYTRKSSFGDDVSPDTVREPPRGMPAIGEVVAGKFRVERLVGSGGMAHVLAARHVDLGHKVAIKVLDPELAADGDAKERFAREARAMATLTSKHTVRVHEVGTLPNGLPFLVMDLLVGRDLAHVLAERGPLPFEEACSYIDQACEAIAEAHDAGLVHRDLKLQNIFLTAGLGGDARATIKVLDFGIARAVGGRVGKAVTITRVGDLIGTLTYMAPEQIRSSKDVNPRADVWALGVCLYKLVTAKAPFTGQFEAVVAEAILVNPPTPITQYRPDVPPVLASVIMRCLRKPLEERFATARELRRALDEVRTMLAIDQSSSHAPDSQSPMRKRVLPPQNAAHAGAASVEATLRASRDQQQQIAAGLAKADAARPDYQKVTLMTETLISEPHAAAAAPGRKYDTTVPMHGDRASGNAPVATAGTRATPLRPMTPPSTLPIQNSDRASGAGRKAERPSVDPTSRPAPGGTPYRDRDPRLLSTQPRPGGTGSSSKVAFIIIVIVVAALVVIGGLFAAFVLK